MNAPSTAQIAARWDLASRTYDGWGGVEGHPAYKRAWADALAELVGGHPRRDGSPALRVADVGTGAAQVALLLAEMGHDVTGCDIAPAMLERARAKAAKAAKACLPVTFSPVTPTTCPSTTPASTWPSAAWCCGRCTTRREPSSSGGGSSRPAVASSSSTACGSPRRPGLMPSARHACHRAFWACTSWRRRCGSRVGNYRGDALQPPGMGWRTVADAHAHFAQAGLHDAQSRWLDALFEDACSSASLGLSPQAHEADYSAAWGEFITPRTCCGIILRRQYLYCTAPTTAPDGSQKRTTSAVP